MPSKQFEQLMVSEIERIDAIFNDPATCERNRVDCPEVEFPGLALVVSRTVALRREVLAWLIARTLRNISYFEPVDEGKSTVVIANHNPTVLLRQLMALLGRLEFATIDQVIFADEDWPKLTSAVNMLDGQEGYSDETVDNEPSFSPDPEARLKWRNGAIGLAELTEIINAQLPGSSVLSQK
ncbi:hypothetical protein [Pseudomonas syringae]|nr:hypothetical protein [Pseudomonas syringae]EPM82434.1 replicative DNA helicase [Pseudomonas syringae pv. actinidiae ICMP 19068]EPM91971.1 replicative DNA helicase [Pseudomonas syringae pv. actinidiae ICMP 19070]BBI45739.1 hypothetical protein KPSA1B_104502 [Pseudomonas syringae pv. actinidiae]